MIIGIGCDIAGINRIEQAIEKFGERFTKKICTPRELEEMEKRKTVSLRNYASSVAKRFAAKEACSKALGTGFRRGVYMADIEIMHEPSGKPYMLLYNGASERLNELTGGIDAGVLVSMSDDYPYAQAFVVIETKVSATSENPKIKACDRAESGVYT
jgi:holo-[acyl-carrier protein] synthase